MTQIDRIVEYLNNKVEASKQEMKKVLSLTKPAADKYTTILAQAGHIIVFRDELIPVHKIKPNTLQAFELQKLDRDHANYYKFKLELVKQERRRFKYLNILEKLNYLYKYENGKGLEYSYSNAKDVLDIHPVQFSYYATMFTRTNYFKQTTNGTYRHIYLFPLELTPTKLARVNKNAAPIKPIKRTTRDPRIVAKEYLNSMEWLTDLERNQYVNVLVDAILWQ